MRAVGLTVVDDRTEAHDLEVRLAVQVNPVGRLARGMAAMQLNTNGRIITQWRTDEHMSRPANSISRSLAIWCKDQPSLRPWQDMWIKPCPSGAERRSKRRSSMPRKGSRFTRARIFRGAYVEFEEAFLLTEDAPRFVRWRFARIP